VVRQIQSWLTIPIHYNDYTIFKAPLEDFHGVVEGADLSASVTHLKHGDEYKFKIET
jgi:hypothetical protein